MLAFHAFLHIWEITVHSRHNNGHSIQFSDVTICNTGIVLVISHNTSGQPVTLTISQTSDAYCPLHALSVFLKIRGAIDGPLFAFANSSKVSRTYFCQYLTKALKWAGLDPTKYKAHSFRIGAGTTAADMGMTETQIQSMGRWNSTVLNDISVSLCYIQTGTEWIWQFMYACLLQHNCHPPFGTWLSIPSLHNWSVF